MATITCQSIVDKVELVLNDEGNDRFDADDLFSFLKSGQRQAAILKPDVSVTNAGTGALTAGTKQSIPAGGIQFIRLVNNLGTNGTTQGPAIQFVDMDTMNDMNPDWHTDTGAAEIQNYIFDEKDPTVYYVYPPQPAASQGHALIVYAITPADPAAIANVITLDDIYETVLIDYILYRAYSIDAAQSPYASQRSVMHWNMFVESLGRKDLKEKMDTPRPK